MAAVATKSTDCSPAACRIPRRRPWRRVQKVEHGPALRWLFDHLVVDDDDDVPDLTGARAKLAVAQEELVRLKIGRESGELVPAAEVQKLREVENSVFRDRLRSVPVTMAERLLDATTKGARAPEIAALLLTEIDIALQDLADMEIVVEAEAADHAQA